jgi:hypothetical protein
LHVHMGCLWDSARPPEFPGAPHTLAPDNLIGINSITSRCLRTPITPTPLTFGEALTAKAGHTAEAFSGPSHRCPLLPRTCLSRSPCLRRELPVGGRPAFLLHAAAERGDPEGFGDVECRRAPLGLLGQLRIAGRLICREVCWPLGRGHPPGGGTAVEGHREPDTATDFPPDVAPAPHRHSSSPAERGAVGRDAFPVAGRPRAHPCSALTIARPAT